MSNRKQYSPEQKVSIVRRHLFENVPVPTCAMNSASTPPSTTSGKSSFLRTQRVPSHGVRTRPT